MFLKSRLRKAEPNDRRAVEILLNYKDRVHRHLDWRSPGDLLTEQPYFVIEKDFAIQAALACPEDPLEVAWIRFFATMPEIPLAETWRALFSACIDGYEKIPQSIVSVAVQSWFFRLLLDARFTLHQTIVVLYLNTPTTAPLHPHQDFQIETMFETELEQVMQVDHAAFAPIWRYSLEDLKSAFQNAAYATVARLDGSIVGYQISSASPLNAHLARLAVLPDMQGRHIGTDITLDMIQHYNQRGIGYITVNTQSDNAASLKLYRQLGFTMTNEKFPVLIYPG